MPFDPSRYVGFESSKTYRKRCSNGFWAGHIKGPRVLDIGYRGSRPDALSIVVRLLQVAANNAGIDVVEVRSAGNSNRIE